MALLTIKVIRTAAALTTPRLPNNIPQRTQQHHSHQTRKLHTTRSSKMPTYIVTCKEGASEEQVQAAKQHAIDQGGKIGHEYKIIKGFSVTFDEDAVTTLESNEHVKAVEADGVMTTQ